MCQENTNTYKSQYYQKCNTILIQIMMLAENIDVKICHFKEVYLENQIEGNVKN